MKRKSISSFAFFGGKRTIDLSTRNLVDDAMRTIHGMTRENWQATVERQAMQKGRTIIRTFDAAQSIQPSAHGSTLMSTRPSTSVGLFSCNGKNWHQGQRRERRPSIWTERDAVHSFWVKALVEPRSKRRYNVYLQGQSRTGTLSRSVAGSTSNKMAANHHV